MLLSEITDVIWYFDEDG